MVPRSQATAADEGDLPHWREPRRLLFELRGDLDCPAPQGVLGRVVEDGGDVLVLRVTRGREHEMPSPFLDVTCDLRQLLV
jgi:hypothetical protein